ncbi:lipopolysaccharide heptosyltransferase II [Roseixanthobacter psychrophilus]|uniref:lipopolysaccharide heptosyltransferase II n=1 Tax=Roseixanthobacter psychrophilus TaxID=3119917 RepID=UPI003D2285B3
MARRHPGVAIDFLCRSPTDRLVRFVPELRKAWVDDTPHRALGLQEKFDLASRLRGEKYRRVYVVSRTYKAAIVPFLAGIPQRVGWFGEGRLFVINQVRWGEKEIHGETEKVCALAREPGEVMEAILPPRLKVQPADLYAWQKSNQIPADGRPVLAIAPGAYNVKRLWPAQRFAEIAAAFAARGFSVWVLGGPAEAEAARIIAAAAPVRDFTTTPLEEAVFQVASSSVVLGNDSGMLHLTGALEVPCVGLFGPTVCAITGPSNTCVREVRPPRGSLDLTQIPVRAVEDALLMQISHLQHSMSTFSFTEQW